MTENEKKMIEIKISSSMMKRLLVAFLVLTVLLAVAVIVLSVLLSQQHTQNTIEQKTVKNSVCLTSSCVRAGLYKKKKN